VAAESQQHRVQASPPSSSPAAKSNATRHSRKRAARRAVQAGSGTRRRHCSFSSAAQDGMAGGFSSTKLPSRQGVSGGHDDWRGSVFRYAERMPYRYDAALTEAADRQARVLWSDDCSYRRVPTHPMMRSGHPHDRVRGGGGGGLQWESRPALASFQLRPRARWRCGRGALPRVLRRQRRPFQCPREGGGAGFFSWRTVAPGPFVTPFNQSGSAASPACPALGPSDRCNGFTLWTVFGYSGRRASRRRHGSDRCPLARRCMGVQKLL